MDTHYTYLLVHLFALAGPLLLSFDRKVHFYKKWKYVFPSMLLPGILFLIWDEYFTRSGVWGFSAQHTIGIRLGSLPLEEVLFFITVPYCCLFIYECVRCYFPALSFKRWADYVLILVGGILLFMGVINFDKAYPAYTFILCSLFIFCLFLFKTFFRSFDSLSFVVSYMITLIPFLIVNGVLTAIPVVWYNDAENLGLRIFSFLPYPMHNIPIEDIFYGMLLILMNVAIYERLRHRAQP
ncbi:MAG: lycopene cyclase domain-containing protein [Bacteroidota bacterium]